MRHNTISVGGLLQVAALYLEYALRQRVYTKLQLAEVDQVYLERARADAEVFVESLFDESGFSLAPRTGGRGTFFVYHMLLLDHTDFSDRFIASEDGALTAYAGFDDAKGSNEDALVLRRRSYRAWLALLREIMSERSIRVSDQVLW